MMGLARFAFMVVAAALMAGCASVTALQAQIASYGQWPAGRAPGTYAFDRLPSQQDQPEQQMLEDAAHAALAAKGFTAAAPGAKPDVLVQVGARVTRYDAGPWGDPWWYGGWYGHGFPGWYHRPWFGPYGYPYPYWGGYGYYGGWYYDRQVALMLRDAASGTPLYEARARSDAYSNSAETLAAMFRAALADFPKSGNVPHSVTVPLAP
ncbi:MAG TPA: DUF4136 domain-containing protein [Burkholderiaceae bacterium]|nr:DUF4136 domain-containing protein [Burkholderiaceae bacterium]